MLNKTIMKTRYFKQLLMALLLMPTLNNLHAATLSGTYSLPGSVAGNTVNNLTQLSYLLSSNTISGTVIFEFSSAYRDTLESFPITFTPLSGTGNVIVRPDASVSTSLLTGGDVLSVALVDLNGINNFSIDGRPGGTGSSVMWQFQNTTSNGQYPTFRLINGASHNNLQYLTIKGRGTSSTGVVVLSTSTVAGGNSYDTIQYCNVGDYNSSYPFNPIISSGTAGANANSNNCILYNNVSNYLCWTSTSPYGGIVVSSTGNGSNWQIIGNSIFSTVNPLQQYGNPNRAIYFNAGSTSTGNVISNNYIGGQSPQCGGGYMKVAACQANGYADFDGIYVSAGGTTNVLNNTIQNIYMTSPNGGSATFRGINIVAGSALVKGNVVGSPTVTASILNGREGTMLGIQNQSSSTVTLDGNTVAGFETNFNSAGVSTSIGHTIGIFAYSNSGTIGVTNIINNQVYNISVLQNSTGNLYFGVNSGGGTSAQPINSYIHNMVTGICVQTAAAGGNQLVSKNTVYNLTDSTTSSGNPVYIYGIVMNCAAGTHTVNGNFIHTLWAKDNFGSSSGNFIGLTGIYLPTSTGGTYQVTDNIIDLGFKPDGNSVQNAVISGIWDNTDYNNVNLKLRINHNSVYIGGTNNNTFSNNLNSYAFRRDLIYGSTVYDSLSIQNNIFANLRSTSSGTGKNYGIYLNSTTDAFTNYNDVYGGLPNFFYGNTGGSDYTTMATFRLGNPGFEANSINSDPQYNSPITIPPDLHVLGTSLVDQAGTLNATIVYDYDSLVRASYSPVDIGATIVCSGSGSASVTLSTSADTVCQGTSVTFTASPSNGGSNPNYNFYKNGTSVQNSTSATYTATLNNGDSVYVIITSNAACLLSNTGISATKKITVVSPTTLPTASITPSANNVCYGSLIAFTASGTHVGTAPVYTFYRNGTQVQTGSGTIYSNSTLNNNDSIWVVLTTNEGCLASPTATSAKFYAVIDSVHVPSVAVQVSTAGICAGEAVNFTATSINPGTSPLYYWRKNGITVSTSGSTYSDNALRAGDVVKVTLVSNATCALPDTAVATAASVTVHPTSTTNRSADICQGNSYSFGGQQLTTAGTYNDTLTSVYGCDSIIQLSLAVHQPPMPVITRTNGDTLDAGVYSTYQWFENGSLINGANSEIYVAPQSGYYQVFVVDAYGCYDTSAIFNLIHTSLAQLNGNGDLKLYPNPTTGELNLQLSGLENKPVTVKLYDAFGNLVKVLTAEIAGTYSNTLHLNDFAAGEYMLQIQSDDLNISRRIELMK